jgi:hypothetical protein
LGKRKADYFWRVIWTTQITLKWLVKLVSARNALLRGFARVRAKALALCPTGKSVVAIP